MKVGISFRPDGSLFDSSRGQSALWLAEALEAANATPVLVNLGTTEWWVDGAHVKDRFLCIDAKELETCGLTLFVDIDALSSPAARKAANCRCAALFRGTLDFDWLERANYVNPSAEYSLEGIDEIWMWDCFNEESSIGSLQTLFGDLPVRRVPFVWTPVCLKGIVNEGAAVTAANRIVIGESNTSSSTNCIVPLTGVSRWLAANPDLSRTITDVCLLNAQGLETNHYFQRNIVENCQHALKQIPITYRGRVPYWALQDRRCIVITHLRFQPLRPGLFDLAWIGIPFIHNSSFLKDTGLADNYYEGNSLEGLGGALLQQMQQQMQQQTSRAWAETVCSPAAAAAGWRAVLQQTQQLQRTLLQPPLGILSRQQAAPLSSPTSPLQRPFQNPIYRIGFTDMWEGFSPADNWFLDVLRNTAHFLDKKGVAFLGVDGKEEPCDLLLFGPFGGDWQTVDADTPKVFFSGERVAAEALQDSRVSLFLTHAPLEDATHMRLPLWLLFLNWFTPQPHLQRNPNSLPWHWAREFDKTAANTTDREFCAFVVSNPGNPVRNAAFETVHSYKAVHSGGAYRNTIGGPIHHLYGGGGGGDVAKHAFLKNHTFCICYENSMAPGYVTEKLLHAKLAGCVPLYWGPPEAAEDMDPTGFINFNGKEDTLLQEIQRLEANPAELARMAAVPALDAARLQNARNMLMTVGKRLLQLCGLLPAAAEAAANPIIEPLAAAAEIPVPLAAASATAAATAAATATATANAPPHPLFATFATKRYLPSLEQSLHAWAAISTATNAIVIVYLGHDVTEEDEGRLKGVCGNVQYRRLPTASPVEGFPDFWEPKMFGWKVWILKTLCEEPALANRLLLYSDAGATWVCSPTEMLTVANEKGICLLTDDEQINRHWCSPAMVQAMNVTNEELAQQQLMAGFQAFVAGHPTALSFYREAFMWASKRECLFGPYLAGTDASGNPIGHRHDQSIYSILSLRQKIPSIVGNPLAKSLSLRKTYQTGAAVYAHRGGYVRHRRPMRKVDDVWVISLDRRADRWASWKEAHPTMSAFANRFCAIDGKTLQLTPSLFTLFERNDFQWKKSVVGCALSHILLWCQLVSEHPDVDNYLIFEDDHRFKDPAWEHTFAAAMEKAPADAELLYFGGVLPGNKPLYSECIEPVNDIWATIRPNNLFTGETGPVVPLFHFCAYSYLLTRKGAEKLLAVLRSEGCGTSIDHFLGWPAYGLKKYVMRDLLATCFQEDDPIYIRSQFDDMKRIDTFDSDIWNNNQCFTTTEFPKGQPLPPLWTCVTDVLKQAPASIQTHLTLREKAVNGIKPMQVFYRNEKDGALERPWLQTLFPGITFHPFSLSAALASPHPWLLFARPHIEQWNVLVRELESHKKGFSILHLSDEGLVDDITAYASPFCKQVLRNYIRPDILGNEKVMLLPLGFAAKTATAAAAKPVTGRKWTWSFHGTRWFNRPALLAPLQTSALQPYQLHFQEDFLDPSMTPMTEYSQLLLNSKYVPVPRGNHCETFRLYEALEHGCIPLYVRTPGDELYWNWLREHIELVELSSWDAAATLVAHLEANPAKAEMYRLGLSKQWKMWKLECGQYL